MMHTEIYCENLDKVNRVKAIRAIQQAYLQLRAIGERVEVDGIVFDNSPVIATLGEVLADAGHIGFENA